MAIRDFFKRESRTGDEEIVAASTLNIANPGDLARLRQLVKIGQTRNKEAWDWYDKIGEVKTAVDRSGKLAGAGRFAVEVATGSKKGARSTGGVAQRATDQLWSPFGGPSFLLSRFVQLMKVEGEAHLVRNMQGGVFTGYDFISSSELWVTDDATEVYRVMLPSKDSGDGFYKRKPDNSDFVEQLDAGSYVGRVWIPHPRYTEMANGGIAAVNLICEELYDLTLGIRSRIMQRLIQAGILFFPSEITALNGPHAEQQSRGMAGGQQYSGDQVTNAILNAMSTNRKNLAEGIASMPMVARGPAAFGEAIRFIRPDLALEESDMKLREQLLGRVLNAMDAEKTTVTGSEDSNHWNSWGDEDKEIRLNVGPDLRVLGWALTAMLGDELFGPSAGRLRIVVDMTDASSRPNQAEDARAGAELGAVGREGLRRMSGMTEDDAPSDEELARMTGWKMNNPYLALYGLPVADQIDWDKVIEVQGKGKTGPNGDQTDPGSKGPDTPKPKTPTPESDKPKSQQPK